MVNSAPSAPESWLVGDIGATHARFGLVAPDAKLLHSRTLADEDYPTIDDALAAFLAERGHWRCRGRGRSRSPRRLLATGSR